MNKPKYLITENGKHLIIDEKNPNGRPETKQEQFERENRESQEKILEEEKEKEKKELQEISNKIENLVIPETNMIPAPMRIFVIEVVPNVVFLNKELNIVAANEFDSGNREDEKKTRVRYFCASVGDNVKKQSFDGQTLEPGDEVMYNDIPDAVRVEIPTVFDYDLLDRTGKRFEYKLFDVMEIAGIVKRKKLI